MQVLAVLVSEPCPPRDCQALDWLLLSSDGEATAEDALRTVARYERRWWIEEFFKVLNAVLNVERIPPSALRDRPPPPAIRETVVNLARLAGFVPSKRQPLPGDTILWNAWKVLKPMVRWEEARLRMTKSAPCAESTARQ